MAEGNITFGGRLLSARRKQKIRINQVEADLCIPKRVLFAFENNDATALPEPAYAVGFLKTYAEYLGLEPAPLVAEVKDRIGPQPLSAPALTPYQAPRSRTAAAVVGIFFILAILGAALYLGWKYFKGPDYTLASSDDMPDAVAALLEDDPDQPAG